MAVVISSGFVLRAAVRAPITRADICVDTEQRKAIVQTESQTGKITLNQGSETGVEV